MSYAHVINNYATATDFFLLLDSKKVLKKFSLIFVFVNCHYQLEDTLIVPRKFHQN